MAEPPVIAETESEDHRGATTSSRLSNPTDHHRQHTPEFAIAGFDGEMRTVHARKMKVCVPSRQCFTFFSQTIAVGLVLIVSMVMMILLGITDPAFTVWLGLFSLSLGLFVPSPDYTDLVESNRRE